MSQHQYVYPTVIEVRRVALPVTEVVYELLDAHDDTVRLADDRAADPRWGAHLQYLRDLQRVGREALAHLDTQASQPARQRRRGRFGLRVRALRPARPTAA
jgi:hypothetical protein